MKSSVLKYGSSGLTCLRNFGPVLSWNEERPDLLDAMGRNAERRRRQGDDGVSHSDVLAIGLWTNSRQDCCAPRRRNDDHPSLYPSGIEEVPDDSATVIGERGFKRAGGRAGGRQRIAIARALYARPAILVLDEASSVPDDDMEQQIMDGLRKAGGELTINALTYRASMIREDD